MIQAALANTPIFGAILLGWVFRRTGFPGDGFWQPAERIAYYVLLPALLTHNLARADLSGIAVLPMASALLAGICLTAALALLVAPFLGVPPATASSVFQGSIRCNGYVGIAAGFAVFGGEGLTLVSVCIAVIVPAGNVLSVIVLTRMGRGMAGTWRAMLYQHATNPMILSCLLGVALNMTGIGAPMVLGPMLNILGQAALAIGLLAVGAGLDTAALRRTRAPTLVATALKLAVMPALTALSCTVVGVDGLAEKVAILFSAVPVAPSAYVFARHMGGDVTMMAAIITTTTMVAALSLPVVVSLLP
ncbi:MAG: AEC family transporter [Alphaproteobacteria bacterium]|nr:AEC family transporter [Alphaproteobacteria bacterium]